MSRKLSKAEVDLLTDDAMKAACTCPWRHRAYGSGWSDPDHFDRRNGELNARGRLFEKLWMAVFVAAPSVGDAKCERCGAGVERERQPGNVCRGCSRNDA